MTSTNDSRYSTRRLREAWDRTWSAKNGILLLSHLHELFDARLFSIHPDTLRIRVFVPYDVISDYHGSIARLPSSVDRRALRHHYEMCCIENMAAEMPLAEQQPASEVGTRSGVSGTASPFDPGSNIPIISSVDARGDTDDSSRYRGLLEILRNGHGRRKTTLLAQTSSPATPHYYQKTARRHQVCLGPGLVHPTR